MNKMELKTLMYNYNRMSERLLHTSYEDFNDNVTKFIRYIDDNKLLSQRVQKAGEPTFDVVEEFNRVRSRRYYFNVGDSDDEEIANIYAILKYFVDNNIQATSQFFYHYGDGSTKWQDMIDGFNDRVTKDLVLNLEAYMTEIGYKLELDEKASITNNISGNINNVSIQQGNNNCINNNSSDFDYEQLSNVINQLESSKCELKEAFGEKSEEFLSKLDLLICQTANC